MTPIGTFIVGVVLGIVAFVVFLFVWAAYEENKLIKRLEKEDKEQKESSKYFKCDVYINQDI